ncbi:MAG: type II toxin-antitoxin system RelE/ParE family toxin [Nitrospirae bacterium]|nr:type II toxin-antitoxin system RelE/ParE family toxin [Nitrospirota bacterium]
MDILYKAPFKKFVKKQTRPFQLVIEDETEKIVNDPEAGELKKGDLAGFRVHKFVFQKRQYLVAYKLQYNMIVVYMIGVHENFYRDLKRYLKEVE